MVLSWKLKKKKSNIKNIRKGQLLTTQQEKQEVWIHEKHCQVLVQLAILLFQLRHDSTAFSLVAPVKTIEQLLKH